MSQIEKLHRTRSYPTLRVESDVRGDAHWLYMHADAGHGTRPCFRTELMDDMWSYLSSITLRDAQRQTGRLRHVVLASDASAFNLGGDLALFSQLIRDNNRERLLAYARRCVDGVHHLHTGLGGDVRTIALVQGDALGGGLELALSCHTIVAEEGVDMGLPEVLFGLFPGMGAYSFLCKRVTAASRREDHPGRQYLHQRRAVPDGRGRRAGPEGPGRGGRQELIRQQQRTAARLSGVERGARRSHSRWATTS